MTRKIVKRSIFFFRKKEIKNSKKNEIKYFLYNQNNEIKITEDNDLMVDEVYNFYNNLMSKDRVDTININNYKFKIKKINNEERNVHLKKIITYDEAYEVIQKMKGAAPGPNGLTIGFYKKYFPFGHHFVDILNNCD